MNMCDYKHEEVVYSSADCPMCDILAEARETGAQLDAVCEKFNELEYEHNRLVDRAKEYHPELLI